MADPTPISTPDSETGDSPLESDHVDPQEGTEQSPHSDDRLESEEVRDPQAVPSENEKESDDEDEEETEDDEWLEADHPLLSRMQNALKKRLNRQLERLSISIIEKEEDLSRLRAERENIGVELYHRQQDLAAEQMKLESTKNKYNNIQIERIKSENGLDELRKQYKELMIHKKLQNKKLMESRQELDSLNQSLRHIVEYQDNMKREILNQRRSAYSSEEIMQELESNKIKQDLLINHLETKISSCKSQIEIYEIQLKVQEEETLSAREILRESLQEMEVIKNEKREYLGKWKSSLIELNKRDDILKNVVNVLGDIEEQIRLKKIEISQFDKDIMAQQEKIDVLQMTMNRMSSDQESMEKKMATNVKLKEELQEKLKVLRIKLNENEETLKSRKLDEKKYTENLRVLEKRYVKVMGEIHDVEEQIEDNYSESITLKHGSENTLNEIKKITKQMHEKEFVVENLKNEIAKLQFQEVRAKQSISDLEERNRECASKLQHNSDIIEEYEREFKKGIDELGKKTNVLDRLNNKLEALLRGSQQGADGDVISSPLEHTIHHLTKELKQSKEKCDALQKKWIVKQTELVNLVNDTMKQEEVVTNLGCKETILSQKRIRLQHHVKCLNSDIKAMHKDISGLRLDIGKLNKHINEYNGKQESLRVECEDIENKYKIDLEVGEEKAAAAKAKIEAVAAERMEIMEKITTCERHILLWERKIKLEIETQKTLDPNYGKKEVEDMKREIHRMEIRLNQLKRKQEDIIKEMELSINKKEMIQLRNMGKNNSNDRGHHRLLNKKQIAAIKSNIKTSLAEKKAIVGDIGVYTERHSQLLGKLDVAAERLNELNETKLGMRQSILQKTVLQKAYLNQIVSKQKLGKEIAKSTGKENEELQSKLLMKQEKKMQKLDQLKERVASLAEQHPQYQSLFNIITNDNLESAQATSS